MAEAAAAPRTGGGTADDRPARRRFTAEEYERMGAAGILHEDERVELIDGEIVHMAAIGSRHAGCVNFLNEWSVVGLAGRGVVAIQNPVRLSSDGEPEPDLALARPRADRYAGSHPGPEDLFLIIEVADTTLGYDRDVKAPRYAAAGIPELWIVDLEGERVLVYRQPRDGRYQYEAVIGRDGTLAPAAFPDLILTVAELFA